MPFCPGYPAPFQALAEVYPADAAYPRSAFRVEWGPIFHRGRLDGTARVLVIGQDPAPHENVARRILVGEAGQRVQGFLRKLGVLTRYVMINAYLYSAYDQKQAAAWSSSALTDDRNAWIDAIFATSPITAVIALGTKADETFQAWKAHGGIAPASLGYAKIMHPTADAHPGISTKSLLESWNAGLDALTGKIVPDQARALVKYGTKFTDADLAEIPDQDLPAGTPRWMRALDAWAVRPAPPGKAGKTAADKKAAARYKRQHLLIEIPDHEIP